MFPYYLDLIKRSALSTLAAVGYKPLGVAVSIIFFIADLLLFLYLLSRNLGRVEMIKEWKQGLRYATISTICISFVAVAIGLMAGVISTVYEDQHQLTDKLNGLSGFATEKQNLEEQLREAKSDSLRWHSAYLGLQKGDIIPDRVLNDEQSNRLFVALKQTIKNLNLNPPPNKNFIKVKIGCVPGDREACHLAHQLFTIFNEAHWNVSWTPKLGIDAKNIVWPLYVAVVSKDRNQSRFIGFMINDAGVQVSEDYNGLPLPPKFNDTIIWVGYKQNQ